MEDKKYFTDIVIIGAGLTGLTIAYYLNKEKKNFIVLEKNERAGGVINTVNDSHFIYEEGPNTGVISNASVVNIFEELSGKCNIEIADKNVGKRYVLKNGKWNALPIGLIDAISTPLFTFKDKLKLLKEPFCEKGKNPDENLASLVKRRIGTSFLNYAIDPFVLGVYAGDPSKLITKYSFPKLYNLEQKYGSFIWGAVKLMLKRKTPDEKKISKKVFSCTGGMSSLINALHKSIGKNKVLLNFNDCRIGKTEDGFVVYGNNKSNDIEIHSKIIVTTIGAYNLNNKLLPFIASEKLKQINSLHYTKVIEIIVGFKLWKGIKTDAFGGLIPFVENKNLLGILFISSLFKQRASESGALFSVFMGGVRKEEIVDFPDDDIYKIIEKEFNALMLCTPFNPDLFKIIRHHKAIPQYGTESKNRLSAIEELQNKYNGLILSGNIRDGIGMADRIKQGKEIAENIISRIS